MTFAEKCRIVAKLELLFELQDELSRFNTDDTQLAVKSVLIRYIEKLEKELTDKR